jgi:ornithine cyclodeaminase/alanine dehydrogenase-like protein (mu-crystallin family)
MTTAIQALRDAFAARARNEGNVIPRTRWEFGERRLNVMGGGLATQRRFALKSYGSSAFHVLLYSEQDGLLAVIEANVLGQIRTGAASAVASEKMARPGASKVALIGTGRQARTQALALSSAGLLKEIVVYGRKRDKLESFCAKLGPEVNAPAHPARSAEEAVADADIVTAATNSATPVVMASWLKPDAHVNGIGANAANRREIDPEIVLKASLVVTDDIPQGQDRSRGAHRSRQRRQARLEPRQAAARDRDGQRRPRSGRVDAVQIARRRARGCRGRLGHLR